MELFIELKDKNKKKKKKKKPTLYVLQSFDGIT